MNAWLREHRLQRHAVQRAFDALERHDAPAIARWRDESGVTAMIEGAFTPPRDAFARALLAPGSSSPQESGTPRWDGLMARWTSAFAERAQGALLRGDLGGEFALDWWLDRVRIWLETEVRRRHGAEIMGSLRAAYERQTGQTPDCLAQEAMFISAVLTVMDASARFRADQPIGPWLRGVAYNVAREHTRVEGRRSLGAALELDPDGLAARRMDPGEELEHADERAWLAERALRGVVLPGESVIVASVLDGGTRSAESLGAELSISVKRVYKRTAAARRRLRDAMDRLAGR